LGPQIAFSQCFLAHSIGVASCGCQPGSKQRVYIRTAVSNYLRHLFRIVHSIRWFTTQYDYFGTLIRLHYNVTFLKRFYVLILSQSLILVAHTLIGSTAYCIPCYTLTNFRYFCKTQGQQPFRRILCQPPDMTHYDYVFMTQSGLFYL
jgi:hypothetical protein